MGHSSSDSDSDSSSRRHKKRRQMSSRDDSSDREKHRKSKKAKHRRRSRSRSQSSERHRSAERSSRHHGRHRSRSSSRSHSRAGSRDRSSKPKSSKSSGKSESRSRESSKVQDLKRGTKESSGWRKTESSSPHCAGLTNAQLSEKLLQKALQAAVGADEILQAQGVVLDDSRVRVRTESATFDEQQRRASAINDIENSEFTPMNFRSSRSEIPLPSGSIVDASHSGAMFGSVNAIAPVVGAATRNGTSSPSVHDDDALMHPSLFVSTAEKMERWKQKLIRLRKRKQENCI